MMRRTKPSSSHRPSPQSAMPRPARHVRTVSASMLRSRSTFPRANNRRTWPRPWMKALASASIRSALDHLEPGRSTICIRTVVRPLGRGRGAGQARRGGLTGPRGGPDPVSPNRLLVVANPRDRPPVVVQPPQTGAAVVVAWRARAPPRMSALMRLEQQAARRRERVRSSIVVQPLPFPTAVPQAGPPPGLPDRPGIVQLIQITSARGDDLGPWIVVEPHSAGAALIRTGPPRRPPDPPVAVQLVEEPVAGHDGLGSRVAVRGIRNPGQLSPGQGVPV